jgi:hypothetical protein
MYFDQKCQVWVGVTSYSPPLLKIKTFQTMLNCTIRRPTTKVAPNTILKKLDV